MVGSQYNCIQIDCGFVYLPTYMYTYPASAFLYIIISNTYLSKTDVIISFLRATFAATIATHALWGRSATVSISHCVSFNDTTIYIYTFFFFLQKQPQNKEAYFSIQNSSTISALLNE